MLTPETACSKGPANLELMSSADLEALLLQDFQSQAEETADMSGLFRAAEVLAQREHAQQRTEITAGAERAWEVFLEKYLPFAGNGRSLYVYESAEALGASAAAVQPQPLRRRKRELCAACLAAILAAAVFLTCIRGHSTRKFLKEMIDTL